MPGHARNPLRDAALPRRDLRAAGRVAAAGGGAQGELTALFVAAAYFRDKRRDAPHARSSSPTAPTAPTPPAPLAGFDAVTVKSNAKGLVDLDDLKAKLDDDTAVFMITNPNTLGLFEPQIKTITDLLHAAGGLVYLDGANMNAILGVTRPGRLRRRHAALQRAQDLHRPARRRRSRAPGRSPSATSSPRICRPRSSSKDGDRYRLDYDRPKSIGRVRSFFGNVGILFRGYCYIRTLGPDGLQRVQRARGPQRQLPAGRVSRAYDVPHGEPCMHEFVASAERSCASEKVRRHGRRQAAARLRLPRADGVLPAGRPRGADDRADRDGEQGNARRLRRCAAENQG